MNIFGKQGKNADLAKSLGLEGLENQFWNLQNGKLLKAFLS